MFVWKYKATTSNYLASSNDNTFTKDQLRGCSVLTVTFWQLRQFDTLREKCTKTEYFKFFFLHIGTDWEDLLRKSRRRKNTDQKKLRIWTLFTQWQVICFVFHLSMGLRNSVFVKTNSVPSFSFWTEKCNLKVINTGFSQVNRKKAALKMSIFSEICGTFIFHVWFV